MAVLIDTSFLLAAAWRFDSHHEEAQAFSQVLVGERLIPAPVLPELFYLVSNRVHYARAVALFALVQTSAFTVIPLTSDDMRRMHQIMIHYEDAKFDFADVAIMALSERLHVTQVCTFDRRDFPQFRPRHADYLELLP